MGRTVFRLAEKKKVPCVRDAASVLPRRTGAWSTLEVIKRERVHRPDRPSLSPLFIGPAARYAEAESPRQTLPREGGHTKKREDNVQEPVKEATARTVGHARWYRALPCTHGRHARAPSVRARVTPHRCRAARTAFFQNARSRRRPDNRLGYLLMASTAGEDGRRIAEPV